MIEVKVDSEKNYIFIKLGGFLHDDEMSIAANKVISEAKKLKKGYKKLLLMLQNLVQALKLEL